MQLVERGVSLAHGLWVVHLIRKKAFQKHYLQVVKQLIHNQLEKEKIKDWSQK